MKINVWQATELARLMQENDTLPEDDDLKSAYADVELTIVDGERLLVVQWEHGPRAVIWHDGTDATDEYPAEKINAG